MRSTNKHTRTCRQVWRKSFPTAAQVEGRRFKRRNRKIKSLLSKSFRSWTLRRNFVTIFIQDVCGVKVQKRMILKPIMFNTRYQRNRLSKRLRHIANPSNWYPQGFEKHLFWSIFNFTYKIKFRNRNQRISVFLVRAVLWCRIEI